MNKLLYRWEKIGDLYYVKTYDDAGNYLGMLTFIDDESFYLFMETAMCGLQGLKNDAPVHIQYTMPNDTNTYRGQIEVIYDAPNVSGNDRE